MGDVPATGGSGRSNVEGAQWGPTSHPDTIASGRPGLAQNFPMIRRGGMPASFPSGSSPGIRRAWTADWPPRVEIESRVARPV
jgi:hypothetical protein